MNYRGNAQLRKVRRLALKTHATPALHASSFKSLSLFIACSYWSATICTRTRCLLSMPRTTLQVIESRKERVGSSRVVSKGVQILSVSRLDRKRSSNSHSDSENMDYIRHKRQRISSPDHAKTASDGEQYQIAPGAGLEY